MNSCGSRGISCRSPTCRADLVAGGDEHRADERPGHRAHPTDDEHRQQRARRRRACTAWGSCCRWPARAGRRPRPTTATLSVHAHQPRPEAVDADRRGGDLVLPACAIGEAPETRLAEHETTTSAAAAATHSHVSVPWRGHAGQPAGATGQLLPVLDALVDDEQHGERDHRRRQPAGAGDGDADQRRRTPWRRRCRRRRRDRSRARRRRARTGGRAGRSPWSPTGIASERRGVRGELGEREVPERQDARRAR